MELREWLCSDRASNLFLWLEDEEKYIKRKLSLEQLIAFVAEEIKEKHKSEKPKASGMPKTSLLNSEITEKQAFQ